MHESAKQEVLFKGSMTKKNKGAINSTPNRKRKVIFFANFLLWYSVEGLRNLIKAAMNTLAKDSSKIISMMK